MPLKMDISYIHMISEAYKGRAVLLDNRLQERLRDVGELANFSDYS